MRECVNKASAGRLIHYEAIATIASERTERVTILDNNLLLPPRNLYEQESCSPRELNFDCFLPRLTLHLYLQLHITTTQT